MNWARNLLFIGLVLAAAGAFAWSLLPDGRPKHWNVEPAVLEDQSFQTTLRAVNASFREGWQAAGIVPAHPTDDLTVARRMSLALTGTVPSLEEIRMFEGRVGDANDRTVGRYSVTGPHNDRLGWWTAGLLRDRRYADYMSERLARAYVGVAQGPFILYRRRRFTYWLSDQLHANRPYDSMVRDLIASDGLWTDKPAVNFVTATIKPDSDEGVDETVAAARVYRAFLGIRIDCAECHDHPFDKWSQEDFHNLAAFFGQTEASLMGMRDEAKADQPYEWEHHKTLEKRHDAPDVPFAKELLPPAPRNQKTDPKKLNQDNRIQNPDRDDPPPRPHPRRDLAAWVTHPKNDVFARATVNRVWALMFGRPLVTPIDNIPLKAELRPKALDILAKDFVEHKFDLQRLIQLITASEVYRLSSRDNDQWTDQQAETAVEQWAVFPMTRLRPEQVSGSVLQAASVQTLDHQTHIIFRVARAAQEAAFIERYGDFGEDEFDSRSGTIPQRLLMLNGELVKERTEQNFVQNAATQIASLAPTDEQAVESAYLACLSRRPTEEERRLFKQRLLNKTGDERIDVMEDIFATLMNATEFSWNH